MLKLAGWFIGFALREGPDSGEPHYLVGLYRIILPRGKIKIAYIQPSLGFGISWLPLKLSIPWIWITTFRIFIRAGSPDKDTRLFIQPSSPGIKPVFQPRKPMG